MVHAKLDHRAETSRVKLCFYHKAEILPQSRKPVGQKYHKAKKFIVIALHLQIIIWQNITFILNDLLTFS